jgi:catechol 2,3-dioxygenase-like lactoylglutathione lyase family enzyme
MAGWETKIGAINLIVGDLERSKEFYREVFGLPIQHEDEDTAMFRFGDTYVFLQRGAAHQDGPSSDVLSLAKKGVGQFVMFAEDVDAVRDELHQGDVAIISTRRTVTGACARSPLPIRAVTPGRSRKSCTVPPARLSAPPSLMAIAFTGFLFDGDHGSPRGQGRGLTRVRAHDRARRRRRPRRHRHDRLDAGTGRGMRAGAYAGQHPPRRGVRH